VLVLQSCRARGRYRSVAAHRRVFHHRSGEGRELVTEMHSQAILPTGMCSGRTVGGLDGVLARAQFANDRALGMTQCAPL